MRARRLPVGWGREARPWSLAARCASALLGGYGAAAAAASLFARTAPLPRVEATAWGMILSFLLYAGLGLWAFSEPRLARVAVVLWGAFAVLAGLVLLLGPRP